MMLSEHKFLKGLALIKILVSSITVPCKPIMVLRLDFIQDSARFFRIIRLKFKDFQQSLSVWMNFKSMSI